MKKFLKKIFYFMIPVFLIWGSLETFYRFVPNNYTQKQKYLKDNYDAEILILGNSHMFYGLNPEFFDKKAYNLSNISQTLYFDELLLMKNINDFPNLKYVFLSVDYFSLSQIDDSLEDKWRKYYYNYYMDLKVPTISIYDPKRYSLALTRKLDRNADLVKTYFSKGTLVECDQKGWGNYEGVNKEYNNLETAKNIAIKHEDGSMDFTNNTERLNKIIRLCKQKNINIFLVTMPVTSNYFNSINQAKADKIFETCNKIALENANVSYINLFQDSRFTNKDFYDTDHLNREGATKCSKILNESIKNNFHFKTN